MLNKMRPNKNNLPWANSRKANQKASCKASAEARRCKVCQKGAAMRLKNMSALVWECRYCHAEDVRRDKLDHNTKQAT